jgi:RNA polymerase sigma factor (sigma-70 family)
MLKFYRPNAPTETSSDEALLDAYVSTGEARFLGKLYERYMPMVYGVCLKILRDPQRAEDAVMAIYEALVDKAREHRIESFRGWLYVLARNHCLMEWRRQQRRPTDLLAPEDLHRLGDAAEAPFEIELPQVSTPLEKCLGELPPQQNRSVRLFYYDEKSYKEIADLLDEDIGKVRSYIQNGRRNLKNCLDRNQNT